MSACSAEIENEICVYGVCGNPSSSSSVTEPWEFLGWHWGTSKPGSDLVPPFLSTGIPLLQGQRGGITFCISLSNGEGALGQPKASLCLHSKTYIEIIWATLSALCSLRQNYKHIRVSLCSSEGKLPRVYVLLISSSFLLAVCWHAGSKRKTWFPSCYTLVELSPKCKTEIRMQGHS